MEKKCDLGFFSKFAGLSYSMTSPMESTSILQRRADERVQLDRENNKCAEYNKKKHACRCP
jgi:hypothetical protein